MAEQAFYNLFLQELSDIYSAENQIVDALPGLIKEASNSELKEALTMHLKETKNQVHRLVTIFKHLGEQPEDVTCEAMEGILAEGEEMAKKFRTPAVKDVAIIMSCQKVEHYEMAVYGSLRTFAQQLDYSDISELLQETLNEEGNANKKLTKIAEGGFFTSGINKAAAKR